MLCFAVVMAVWAAFTQEGFAPYFRHMAAVLPFLFLVAVAGVEGLARGPILMHAVRAACLVFAVAMHLSLAAHAQDGPDDPAPVSDATADALGCESSTCV